MDFKCYNSDYILTCLIWSFFIMLQNSGHFIITNFYSDYIYHLPEVIGSIHLIYADKELKPFLSRFCCW